MAIPGCERTGVAAALRCTDRKQADDDGRCDGGIGARVVVRQRFGGECSPPNLRVQRGGDSVGPTRSRSRPRRRGSASTLAGGELGPTVMELPPSADAPPARGQGKTGATRSAFASQTRE